MDRETVRRAVIDVYGSWGRLRWLAAAYANEPATAAKRIGVIETLLARIDKPAELLDAIGSEAVEREIVALAAERPQFAGEYCKALPQAAGLADAIGSIAGEGITESNCHEMLQRLASPELLKGDPERWIQAAEMELASLPAQLWKEASDRPPAGGRKRSRPTALETKKRKANAIVLASSRPDLTHEQIAKEVGLDRKTLERSELFRRARTEGRATGGTVRRGSKVDGHLEAYDERD